MIDSVTYEPAAFAQQHVPDRDGGCEIEYYTLQPAPTQWVAVGRRTSPVWTRSLVVGAGSTEDAAVENLRDRCPHGHPETSVMVRLAPGERFD
jgi:hypothetical protein